MEAIMKMEAMEMPGKIKLYQFSSCPYCGSVRAVLEEKGIAYEKIEVPTDREERKELFEVSGQYLVPVIVDGDIVINDSGKIIAYLNEKY
jgi:glutathione S-transferase